MTKSSGVKTEKIYPMGYTPTKDIKTPDPKVRNQLIHLILSAPQEEAVDTDLF